MNQEERENWANLKITSDTFKKTPQEKLALKEAKRLHKESLKLNHYNLQG